MTTLLPGIIQVPSYLLWCPCRRNSHRCPSTLSALFLSKHTRVHSTWERKTGHQGMLPTSRAQPTRWWALAICLPPSPPRGKTFRPSLQCSSSSCALNRLHSSFLKSCPHSTNHCPSYCIWDFPFSCPLTMNNQSNPLPSLANGLQGAHFLIPHPHHIQTVNGNTMALARSPISTWLATTKKFHS